MKIRQGTLADCRQFEQVLLEAASRIKKTGSSQWSHILAGEERDIVAARLNQGDAYLVEETVSEQTRVMAVFYLYQRPNEWDQAIWQEEEKNGVYYLHRLSLADNYTGKGLAKELLELLQKNISKNRGLSLRLDCISTQPVLNNLYQQAGFSLVKKIKDLNAGGIVADFNLYQYDLTRSKNPKLKMYVTIEAEKE